MKRIPDLITCAIVFVVLALCLALIGLPEDFE